MKYILMAGMAFLFLNCNQPHSEYITSYKGSSSLEIQAYWVLKGKKKFVVGNRLTLDNRDSSFTLKSCGCQSTGTWIFFNDTLFLDYQEVNKVHDSIRKCYQPDFYNTWLGNNLVGQNRGEYIEVLKVID